MVIVVLYCSANMYIQKKGLQIIHWQENLVYNMLDVKPTRYNVHIKLALTNHSIDKIKICQQYYCIKDWERCWVPHVGVLSSILQLQVTEMKTTQERGYYVKLDSRITCLHKYFLLIMQQHKKKTRNIWSFVLIHFRLLWEQILCKLDHSAGT